ncbi:MAG: alpha-L-arabinofuranosidase, partial [Armatimonadota bacterium]|nr:alpha-L-arabinofuranosidase [Armatimonadota bacterium]
MKNTLCLAALLCIALVPLRGLAQAGDSARITVDWGATTGHTTPLLFGANDWAAIQSPGQTLEDAQFAKILAQTHLTFVRIHNGGLSDAWSSNVSQTWEPAKIKAVYDAPYLQGKTILQNIPGWPGWMKQQDKILDPSEYDRYARFCADLVRIINKDQHRHVRLWEPFNEEDQNYWDKGKFDDLCRLYNKVAVAMKAVDSSIQVGGLAFIWDDPAKVEAFLKNCGPNVDFLTWHRYAGAGKDATDKIMADTPHYEDRIRTFRALTQKYAPGRTIPLVWDEYSLAYTYQSPETRQWSNVGAVWFASTLKHMADAGLDMAAQWNLRDGFYGLVDNSDAPRPALTVFAWGNKFLVGSLVKTQSDQPLV